MAVQAPAAIQQFLWWKTGSLAKKSVEFPLFFVVHKTIRRSQYFIPFFMDVLLPGNFIFCSLLNSSSGNCGPGVLVMLLHI